MAYEGSTSFPVPPREDIEALLKSLGLTGKPLPGPFLPPESGK